jgi:uncharacterized protein YceK
MKTLAPILFMIAAVLCSGCGTVGGHVMGRSSGGESFEPLGGVYQGVRVDYAMIAELRGFWPVVGILDFPLSLVADTVILPFDALEMTAQKKKETE